jgi:hypothetical protein
MVAGGRAGKQAVDRPPAYQGEPQWQYTRHLSRPLQSLARKFSITVSIILGI